jgi:hypothetical protein
MVLAFAGAAGAEAQGMDDPPPAEGEGDLGAGAGTGTEAGVGTEEAAGTEPIGDEQAVVSERMGTEEFRDSTDPYEDPTGEYYFVGLFYRHIFVPEFLLNLFTDESTGASNPAFGAEFTYRKGGFDIIGSLWYALYSVEGAFRGAGDPVQDTEWIESNLGVLFISGTFLWSTAFNDIFALEYGVALGVGLVLGDMQRTEAHPSGGGFAPCNGPGDPDGAFCDGPPITGTCEGEGGHYCEEAQWSGGGSVPNVVPWLAIPQIALRIKPMKQLMMRIEGGFGLGFFLGGAVNYGF